MNLPPLFQQRLLLVSGKGGVGKTTLTATLGKLAASSGKKTLLVELSPSERIAELFGIPPIGYQEIELAPNLYGMNLDPESAFREYVLSQLDSPRLYKMVFENRFVRNFLEATPGLHILLQVGKIWSLVEERRAYDLVIVDAPATGHGLAMLKVPQVVAEAVRVGPLKSKSEAIQRLFQDFEKTALLIVTLPEEMPVNEALEMKVQAESSVGVRVGPLFVNAVFPEVFAEEEFKGVEEKFEKSLKRERFAKIEQILQNYQNRFCLQKFYLQKLKNGVGKHPMVILPYLFDSAFGLQSIEKLKEILSTH